MSLYLGGIGHFKIYWKSSGPSGVGGGLYSSGIDIIHGVLTCQYGIQKSSIKSVNTKPCQQKGITQGCRRFKPTTVSIYNMVIEPSNEKKNTSCLFKAIFTQQAFKNAAKKKKVKRWWQSSKISGGTGPATVPLIKDGSLRLPSRSLTVRPWKVTFPVGNWSSNHHFSGAMLNLGGVSLQPWLSLISQLVRRPNKPK